MNNTFEHLMRDLSRHAIGFEGFVDHLNGIANTQNQKNNYPPYNIRKLSEHEYTIELAVAGFEEADIDIELTGERLTISGQKPENFNEDVIYQGLAMRNFSRTFVIAEHIEVKGAALANGILCIALEKILPEKDQPRKIQFQNWKKLFKK